MKDKTRSQIHIGYFVLIDIFLTAISIPVAYALRLDDKFPAYVTAIYWTILIALLIKPAIYYFFGMYRRLWAYASVKELLLLVTAVSAASGFFSAVMLLLLYATKFLNFPRLMLTHRLAYFPGGNRRFSVLHPGDLRQPVCE